MLDNSGRKGGCNATQDAQDAQDAKATSPTSGRSDDVSDAGNIFADVLQSKYRYLPSAGSGVGVPSSRRSGRDSRTMRSKGCRLSFARSQAQMSLSSLRKMRSRRGRGDPGESHSAQLSSPVAPIRYRGVSIACSTRCALTTPSSFCMLGDARTPQAIPRSKSLADQEWPRNGCPTSGAPILRTVWTLIAHGQPPNNELDGATKRMC